MYKKILVPVDGSDNSIKALKHAVEIAAASGGEITMLHVLDLPPQLKSLRSYSMVKEQLTEEGAKILENAAGICSSPGVVCNKKTFTGIPAEEIIKEAQNGRFDLVVMGSRGMGDVKGWLLGSVSRRVVRYSKSPVLIVR